MLLPSTTYQSTTTESVNVNEAPSRRFYCAAASFSSAGLIHEVAGSSGGSGGLRTNRFSRAVAGAAARARQQLAGVDLAVDLTKARVADLHPDVLVRIAVHETHRAGDEGHATLGERSAQWRPGHFVQAPTLERPEELAQRCRGFDHGVPPSGVRAMCVTASVLRRVDVANSGRAPTLRVGRGVAPGAHAETSLNRRRPAAAGSAHSVACAKE